MQPIHLASLGCRVWQQVEDDVHRVKHDSLCLHLIDFCIKNRQHAAEIKITRLNEIGRRLGIQNEELLRLELFQMPTEAGGIGGDALW